MQSLLPLTESVLNYISHNKGDFNQLALNVFYYQYQYCEPYQRYCNHLNKTPNNILQWQDIPAVSTEAFREFTLTTLPISTAHYTFQTSGTSQENKGKHYYHDMTLYNAAIRSSFMKGLGLSIERKYLFRVLTPPFSEVSTSSLFYMFQQVLNWYGESSSKYYFKNDALECEQLVRDLQEDEKENRAVVLLGTAFSWVNFFDYLQENDIKFQLPPSSCLMETGGLKGKTRSVSRQELYSMFENQLGFSLNHCFSEYGMTELSSQSYSKPNSHCFRSPSWMPVQIINPETGKEVALGETGLVQFFDLANITAVSAIITSDLAIKHADSFELIGRAPKAILRGCSTAFE